MAKSLTLKKKPATKTSKKVLTRFRPRVRSRHPSHAPLRTQLQLLPFRSIVRLGSTTVEGDNHRLIECNTVEAIQNSANKLFMKQCFSKAGVKSAEWIRLSDKDGLNNMKMPIVIKSHMGSRGRGNFLINTLDEMEAWNSGNRNLNNYIVERYYDYVREYRLHVTKDGCFYTCRKMLKSDTPADKRWFRNDSNSTWIMETNPAFDKPSNWDAIVSECVKALISVGLDVGACDVKVQSSKDKKGNVRATPEFIVIEINSAPSFGEETLRRYLNEIPRILSSKKNG